MPLNTDIRQAIVVALQAEGVDAGAQVADILARIARESAVVREQAEQGLGFEQAIPMLQKLAAEGRKWTEVLNEINDQKVNPDLGGFQKIDVGLHALQLGAVKFRDQLEKLESTRLEKLADAADKAHRTFEATVISTDQLAASATKLKSDKIDQAETAAQKLRDAFVRAGKSVAEANTQMQGMTPDQINALADATKQAAAKTGGFATAADKAADQSKKMGYAAMNASYMFQDLQYGVGAIANNIGLMASSLGNASPWLTRITAGLGGPVGLGAGLMAVTVAADLLYKNWGSITAALGQGIPPKIFKDVKDLEAELKALEEIKVKTSVDFNNIRAAREELQKLTAEEAAYQRLKSAKSEEQQKRSEVVSKAIIEGGGADDFASGAKNVAGAVAEATVTVESGATAKAREKLAWIDKQRAAGNVMAAGTSAADRTAADKNVLTLQARDTDEHKGWAQRLVGGAAEGKQLELDDLRRMFEANPQAFTNRGIDPLRFGAGLENAAPANLFGEERRKAAEEADAKARAARDKRDQSAAEEVRHAQQMKADKDRDRGHRITEATGQVKGGVDDALEKSVFDAVKGGATPENAMKGQRGDLIATLRKRNVGEDVVGDVASKILEKARDSALNLIQEGGKPKLDVKAEQEANKEATKANKAKADFEKQVGQVDQAFTDRAAAMFAQNSLGLARGLPVAKSQRQERDFLATGQNYSLPPDVLSKRVERAIARDLRDTGQDPKLAGEIQNRAADLFGKRRTEAVARTPLPDPTEAAPAMAHQTRAIAALQQVLAGFGAKLDQQEQQAQRNVMGPAQPQPRQQRQHQVRHGQRDNPQAGGFRSVPPSAEPTEPEAMSLPRPAAQGDNLAPAVSGAVGLAAKAGTQTDLLIGMVGGLMQMVEQEKANSAKRDAATRQLFSQFGQLRNRRPPLGPMDLGGS